MLRVFEIPRVVNSLIHRDVYILQISQWVFIVPYYCTIVYNSTAGQLQLKHKSQSSGQVHDKNSYKSESRIDISYYILLPVIICFLIEKGNGFKKPCYFQVDYAICT